MSTILVDSISDTAGTGSPSFPNGISGNGSALTSLTSANLTGALPAIDGSALTSLTSANLTGALPAIDGSALTGVGGLQFISSIDLSGEQFVDFTGFDSSLYDSYEFTLSNVTTSIDGSYLMMRTSSDGGSTFDSGTGNYSFTHNWARSTSNGADSSTTTTAIFFNVTGIGNAAGEDGASGVVQVLGPHLPKRTRAIFHIIHTGTTGLMVNQLGTAERSSSADVDGIRFRLNLGFMTSGTITMYGKVNS